MFFFGSPEDTRDLYLSNAFQTNGPDLDSESFDELDRVQQKLLFTYIYLAYNDALADEVAPDMLSAIVELYDEVFTKMAQGHPDFCEAVKAGRHVYLPDYSVETTSKYQGIVDAALKASAN